MSGSARQCSQCGASVELPPAVRSTTCPFCASALVDATAELDEPVDRVAPFLVDRTGAATRIGNFLAGRWFAPESVRRASGADELRDVLVPFYAFDAVARTSFAADVGIHWQRTETYTVTVNGKTETRTRTVTETEWFPLSGSHVGQWFDQLVSASRGLPEAMANALEPFDLGATRPYSPTLVAGFVAERATVPHAEAEHTARVELAEREQQKIARDHLPGDKHRGLNTSTVADLEPARLVLLPVWVSVVKGPKEPIRIVVNGQTGEVVASKIPTEWWKVALVVAFVLAVLAAILFVVFGSTALLALLGAA